MVMPIWLDDADDGWRLPHAPFLWCAAMSAKICAGFLLTYSPWPWTHWLSSRKASRFSGSQSLGILNVERILSAPLPWMADAMTRQQRSTRPRRSNRFAAKVISNRAIWSTLRKSTSHALEMAVGRTPGRWCRGGLKVSLWCWSTHERT